jgi:hypothetical protein
MPGRIRHPEDTEITGFQIPDRVQDRLHRNDTIMGSQTFYETINTIICKFTKNDGV